MDSQSSLQDDQHRGRPHRERMPPRYLQDYRTELYGNPPQQPLQSAEPAAESSETALLRSEVADLKDMVRELIGRVEQYEQSSGGDSESDNVSGSQVEPSALNVSNQPLHNHVPCEKSHSEPILSEPVNPLCTGKISQSVQTLFPYCHHAASVPCKHKRTIVVPDDNIPGPSSQHQDLGITAAPVSQNPVSVPYLSSSSVFPHGPITHAYSSLVLPSATPSHQGPLSQPPLSVPVTQGPQTYLPSGQRPLISSHQGHYVQATHGYHSQPLPPMQGMYAPSYQIQPSSIMVPQVLGLQPSVNPPSNVVPYPQSHIPQQTVQQMVGSRYSLRVEGPSFPYFSHNDPYEFVLLKMALTNLLPADESEMYKYHILLDHLRLPAARHIALSYAHNVCPYTTALAALERQFGQPHQLALKEIQTILNLPKVVRGDGEGFQNFAVRVRSLVGMLQSLGPGEGATELTCASHVHRLLSKLPAELVSNFVRYARVATPAAHYNLVDFAAWLEGEAECQAVVAQASNLHVGTAQVPKKEVGQRYKLPSATILHGADRKASTKHPTPGKESQPQMRFPCVYCQSDTHYLTNCENLKRLSIDEVTKWLKEQNRCWKCGRTHKAVDCTLKKPCPKCNGQHLGIFHEVQSTRASRVLYVNPQSRSPKVLLKVVKVRLSNNDRTFDTYAILDDGSERTMLLPGAAKYLGLKGEPEKLKLCTVRQQTEILEGRAVNLQISAVSTPEKRFSVDAAFTSDKIMFVEQSYPVDKLKQRYSYLHDIPLKSFTKVQPHILIGSDNPFLITPIEVRYGPKGTPAAVKTRLGWALQGPVFTGESADSIQCLFTSTDNPFTELKWHVEQLWQVDTLPFRNEKLITRSKQDKEAMDLLQEKTIRVKVDGTNRYGTPLLRRKDSPKLKAPVDSVMPLLRKSERRLEKTPELAAVYNTEIDKLDQAGYIAKLSPELVSESDESWYIPHHLVEHNGKPRVVFNCSFSYQGLVLNDQLLPGPTLGPTLIGVLLRFRQHKVAMSGDIKGMFHQVRLLPEDKPLLRFLWRDMQRKVAPTVFEWQVLPFGTTCSPCCAIYALQKHVKDHSDGNEDVVDTVLNSFYVDNCLTSLPSPDEAKLLLLRTKDVLSSGGFEIRQWASNVPSVVDHLPQDARSDSAELWLNQNRTDPIEGALGLSWHCVSDTLGYKHKPIVYQTLTMRNVYKVLASQYDPLGYIIPFTTRAKVLLQQLWITNKQWDQTINSGDLYQAWNKWEGELPYLDHLRFPRWYNGNNPHVSHDVKSRELHVFCDASERAYGSVAYMKTTSHNGNIDVSFVMARSRVAPLKQLTIPRLELSAALTGAQLSRLIITELSVSIDKVYLWSDSTVVLTWLHSDSCRFKAFVANRIVEILELTSASDWRYVESKQNPADDITRGKPLKDLNTTHRWHRGPTFLYSDPSQWPVFPTSPQEIPSEMRKPFCGITQSMKSHDHPDPNHYDSWPDLVDAMYEKMKTSNLNTTKGEAETQLISHTQSESFPEEFHALRNGKEVPQHSRLLPLSPEFDDALEVIRVGGRLRQTKNLESDTVCPIVLDPKHHVTQLLIKDYDQRLLHPGSGRVFAEIRRAYWILRGRQAVKKHQWSCIDCRKWRAKPTFPKMADLPPSRLRLWKPPFWSTGVDCFGPLTIKLGRRTEKRWGILFKCMTTRCIHIELLHSLDSDSFLLSLRRFIARRGRPHELLSDCGTNFKGGDKELRGAFAEMNPQLKEQLKDYQIEFHFNPPSAPHFGGMWEREIRSVKAALKVAVGSQTVSEEVLHTVLMEIEGILNSKPIGYASSDIADPDPVTPNLLLMGRRDASLPQAVYADTSLMGRKRWRHSQVLADQFWSSFIRNYLPNLQVRNKWQRDSQQLTKGATVLFMDPQLPRGLWPVAKVSRVIPSHDGRIRTAEITYKDKTLVRPVAKLVVLSRFD